MATFMVDYLNGNNNRGGDSWSVTLTSSDGVTNGTTTFTSATGGFTGKENRYIYVASATPFWGTIVTVNSDTEVILSGTIASESSLTFYIGGAWADLTNGATAARLTASDEVRIAKSSDPTSTSQNATWTDLSKTVTLTTAVTANIDLCENAWTDDTGGQVTCTADGTDWKEGTYSAKFVIAAGASTGLLAHYNIADTDYSGYQQVSFWIKSSVALAANDLSILLCSDDAGTTAVNTINIPAIAATSVWYPITVNTAGALGASIKAVSLYMNVDKTGTIYLDNIIACKASSSADSITLQSLISKNTAATGGDESWYGIQSINGTTILLDNAPATLANAGRGYSGTTASPTLYKRETTKIIVTGTTTNAQTIEDENIIYKGGYNISSGEQDGETFFDGLNGLGRGIYNTAKSNNTIERLSFIRYTYGIIFLSSSNSTFSENNTINIFCCNNNTSYGFYAYKNSFKNTINVDFANNNGTSESTGGGIGITNNTEDGTMTGTRSNIITFKQTNNNSSGCVICYDNKIYNGQSKNNYRYGIYFVANTFFDGGYYNITTADNTLGSIATSYLFPAGNYYCKNCTFGESTIWYPTNYLVYGFTKIDGMALLLDNSSTDFQIYKAMGTIKSETSVRHTASGLSWKLNPGQYALSNMPLRFKVARILCTADKDVTVTLWARRSHADLTLKAIVYKNQIAGITTDISDSVAEAADTWEQLSLTLQPTANGFVDLWVESYGGTTYSGYIDDITVTTEDNISYTMNGLDYGAMGEPIFINANPRIITYGSASIG